MFSTSLGKSRQGQARASILLYLEKLIKERGGDPENFVVETVMTNDCTDDKYRVICCKCKQWFEQVLCDWSPNFDVDGLAKAVLEFESNHRHGQPPVLDVVGSFKPIAAVEQHPQGYRKFREV